MSMTVFGSAAARVMLAGAALGCLSVPVSALADEDSLSANVGLVSDYRFRGISQTFRKPAIQGGVDYALSSGFYIGTWASTIDKDFLTDTNGIELDVYGGYKFPLGAGWTGDVGLLQYLYPGESLWNTTELYVGGSWQWFSVKYSHSIGSKTFGYLDSRGSGYIEVNASYPLKEGLNLVGHVGSSKFRNNGASDYTDYKIGVTYDWSGLTFGVAAIGASEDVRFTKPNGKSRDLGKAGVVLSVSKTF